MKPGMRVFNKKEGMGTVGLVFKATARVRWDNGNITRVKKKDLKIIEERKSNIARKQDVPWHDPAVQAHWQAGFHSAWDEPEDHPQYPMAGDLQKQLVRPESWKRLQASRMRMYGRKKMNPSPYYGDYDYEEAPEIYCPACGGEPTYMGTLGNLDWFRCRRCGWQFSMKTNPAELAQDVIAVYSTKGGAYQLFVLVDFDGCYVIKHIDHGRYTGGSSGICSEKHLNDKLMQTIYYAQAIDGINYELVFP